MAPRKGRHLGAYAVRVVGIEPLRKGCTWVPTSVGPEGRPLPGLLERPGPGTSRKWGSFWPPAAMYAGGGVLDDHLASYFGK